MIDVTTILTDYGYISLFVTSFLASTILPLGSEGLVALMVIDKFNIYSVVIVASVANFLGACTSYYIGFTGRGLVINKYMRISDEQIQRVERGFEKYGGISLLFTWLPGIGDAIAVAGGLLRYNFAQFTVFVFIGKAFRYMLVAYVASQY
ncbi:membrane protein YqaA, SNARE-associated domain [Methanolobus vulcani]|jgi:membrane protein YqaA with SNARE-associated domain|uniref:Membrane protein YqaA, SNARE-associated domain n=1 Tax=Methanolobus vulcani TaxID=38026 RepID=A0A7Z7AWD3_9EURY|nr:YqaA family protein [Methanolobus vulcani]SDF80444.1 membrane protein YqaA, SNARE-associated domain [Methanolobus vulcani]